MLVSFINNTTGVASGAGTANLSGTPVISEVRIVHSLVFCVVFCRSLVAVLSNFFVPLYRRPILLRIMASNYPFALVLSKSPLITSVLCTSEIKYELHQLGCRRGRDRMAIGYITTYVISAYHH